MNFLRQIIWLCFYVPAMAKFKAGQLAFNIKLFVLNKFLVPSAAAVGFFEGAKDSITNRSRKG